MDTHKILWLLESDPFVAAVGVDTLPRDAFVRSVRPGMFVVNTEDVGETGEHWVTVFVDGDRFDFYDTYGRPPSSFPAFQRRLRLRSWKDCLLQRVSTNVGGDYCVLVCLLLARRLTLPVIVGELLSIPDAETRDQPVRAFLLDRFGIDAVAASSRVHGLDGVHVTPLP